MITLKKIEWSNFRSYGDNNFLHLNTRTLTQLLGDNGVGKTTVPLMLQELLYGKNIKGVKKEGLSNRYTDKPGYQLTLFFSKDSTEYCIDLNRQKTKVTLKLIENGEDISSHTATNTYKSIAKIIGIPDFKTFCQLTYQSTTDALDFLTATDTTRKKFLISLLDLSQYLSYQDVLKAELKVVNTRSNTVQGALDSNKTWLARHTARDLTPMPLMDVVLIPSEITDALTKIKQELDDIAVINRKITTNNKYKADAEALGDVSTLTKEPLDSEMLITYATDKAGLNFKLKELMKELKHLNEVNTIPTCSKCGQDIPFQDTKADAQVIKDDMSDINVRIRNVASKEKIYKEISAKNTKVQKTLDNYEYHMSRVDTSLSSRTLDAQELSAQGMELSKTRVELQANIDNARKNNIEASAHNSSIDTIKQQIRELKHDITKQEADIASLGETAAYLTILRNAFSTNGLVSYKVEASVKVLETTINSYLSEFSEFRIRFKLAGEKLNVEVFDNFRNIIDIQTVSTGELGRINIATGLAIRKLLSTLTSTRLNFLFLDEIIGVLDSNGKESLFEILQKEDLNTIMVAHEETHPLIPKIEINKTDNISRLTDE